MSDKIKKGAVIQRRHNHTVNTAVAQSDGKWMSTDKSGVLVSRKDPRNQIIRIDGVWRSVSNKPVTSRLLTPLQALLSV